MKKVIAGINDLTTTNPELMKDWDYSKNTDVDPHTVSFGSGTKVWWKCSVCGYEWRTKISNRAGTLKRGCPKCGRKIASNKVSLTVAKDSNIQKTYPNIAEEWHPTKNGYLSPKDISYGSESVVWWKCSWCGYEYQQRINKRTLRNFGCPQCAKASTSFAEQSIYYYLSKVFDNVVNRDTSNEFELDIYIPLIKTAVEYDGVRWHKNKNDFEKDNEKDKKCLEKNIRLIRFRDYRLLDTNSAETIKIKDGNISDLENGIKQLFIMLGKSYSDISINRDTADIMSLYKRDLREKSLGALYPQIAKELHPTKNGDINAYHIYPNSPRNLLWVCPICGNEYKTSPNHRVNRGSGCPVCNRKKVYKSNQIKVVNVDTGQFFDSIREAADWCNGDKGSISECCNNKQKTAFGYRWQYLDKGRRKHKNNKILCVETGVIFDSDKEAAKWCNGDNRNINSVCFGRSKTYRGYHWKFVED